MSALCNYQRLGVTVYPIEAPSNATLRTINSFLIDHADGLYLIDAGMNDDACWEALLEVLQQLQYAITDLMGIILTHHHPDHVGLVHRIRKLHPAVQVYAHPLTVPYVTDDTEFLTKRIAFFEQLYREMDGMPEAAKQIERFKRSYEESKAYRIEGPIERIQEGDSLIHLTVYDVPGHAPDHIMLVDAKRRWAFVGDVVIEHMSTNAIIEPDAQGRLIPTVTQQLMSLKRCLSLDVDLLFTGHGQVIHSPQEIIASKIARIEYKLERILQFIRDGYDTAGSMARLYDKDILNHQYFLVMSEVIGILDHLERRGDVVRQQIEGIYHYALTRRDSLVSI